MTAKQIRTILAQGHADELIHDWASAKADFVTDNGPLRKPWAAVLVAALTATPPWNLPKSFTARRRQMQLREMTELERARAAREAAAAAAIAASPEAQAASQAAFAAAKSTILAKLRPGAL